MIEVRAGRVLSRENAKNRGADAIATSGRQHRLQRVPMLQENPARSKTLHHIYDVGRLRRAYRAIEHDAAAGIDGETWKHYGENLEENLRDLSGRLARGAYRARPVRRVYIEKADGRNRPLGVPVLEDKIVQRSVVEVLNAIYEVDFLVFVVWIPAGAEPASGNWGSDGLFPIFLSEK